MLAAVLRAGRQEQHLVQWPLRVQLCQEECERGAVWCDAVRCGVAQCGVVYMVQCMQEAFSIQLREWAAAFARGAATSQQNQSPLCSLIAQRLPRAKLVRKRTLSPPNPTLQSLLLQQPLRPWRRLACPAPVPCRPVC